MDEKLMSALTPISQGKNKLVLESIKGDWVTNIWYEKILLLVCIAWTLFSGGYLLYRWLF